MVGKQKSCGAVSTPGMDIENSFLILENSVLKTKNTELAKALTDAKQKYAELIKEMHYMRTKLFQVESENLKMVQVIKRMADYSKTCLTRLVSASNDITDLFHEAGAFIQPRNNLGNPNEMESSVSLSLSNNSFSKGENKTQAVKPMVSGHTILRPTINLERVSTEQLEQLMNLSGRDMNVGGQDENDEPHTPSPRNSYSGSVRTSGQTNRHLDDDNTAEDVRQADSANQPQVETPDFNRLETLQEASEEENSLTLPSNVSANTNQSPYLSGVFKDVRVYISPTSIPPSMQKSAHRTTQHHNMNRLPIVQISQLPFSPSNRSTSSTQTSHVAEHTPICSSESQTSQNNGAVNGESIFNETTVSNSAIMRRIRPDVEASFVSYKRGRSYDKETEDLDNISTLVNASMNNSGLQNLSDAEVQLNDTHDNGQNNNNNCSIPISSSNIRAAKHGDKFDPLEGPSTLLDNLTTQSTNNDSQEICMNLLGLMPVDSTSTPVSPTRSSRVTKRRRILTTGVARLSSPLSTPTKVTRRRLIKKENIDLSNYTNCMVHIPKLSNDCLNQHSHGVVIKDSPASSPQMEINRNRRTGRSSGAETTVTPNSATLVPKKELTSIKKRGPLVPSRSPIKRRNRNIQPGMFKERSLVKKMRRSK